MRKAAQARPNERLKRERELMGWSQKYVAEQLGADIYAVSRWERGLTTPSPYYRQRLCELFGKNTQQLGIISEQRAENHEIENRIRAAAEQQISVEDPELPLHPTDLTGLIGRAGSIEQLKAYLCSEQGDHVAAISELLGVGKTTLTLAIAYDEDIQQYFCDGILWVGLGPRPDVQGLLSRRVRMQSPIYNQESSGS